MIPCSKHRKWKNSSLVWKTISILKMGFNIEHRESFELWLFMSVCELGDISQVFVNASARGPLFITVGVSWASFP